MKRSDKPGCRTVSISFASKLYVEEFVGCEISDAIPRADGRYDVEMDDEILAALQKVDPDVDKAIKYLCRRKR